MSDQADQPATPVVYDPIRAQLAERATQRAVARELRNKQWGKDLGEDGIKALSLWVQRHGVEPATEVEVLGGNIYLNHRFYLRKLAQLISAEQIEYARADHVERDERLEALAGDKDAPQSARDEALGEVYRRKMERIAHHLPEEAKAAVVYRIKVRGMTSEVTGAKAAGGYRGKNERGGFKDPIGEEFPAETAESRAARRAARQIIDAFPDLRAEMDVVEAEAKLVAVEVQASRARVKAAQAVPSLMSGRPVEHYGYGDLEADAPAKVTASSQSDETDEAIDRRLAAEDEAEAKDGHQDMDAAERRGER